MTEFAHCEKRSYRSERSARQKLRELRRSHRHHFGGKTEDRAYQCPHCRAWHLTSHKWEG